MGGAASLFRPDPSKTELISSSPSPFLAADRGPPPVAYPHPSSVSSGASDPASSRGGRAAGVQGRHLEIARSLRRQKTEGPDVTRYLCAKARLH